ncbi:replication restart helicase PriA [Phorcysia thermohydrogeniphila]|uniref:Replication restart protein PriA n=1 Tax=Phorcysia thermohydrogeniphila TaxID=936138 RepID=A0A4R1G5V7_9BACT|nr:primosomal protein N' [Phorcysia thermohydrogeniphila]TCK02848.1 replication restart DNA helicase PriA [Phorcysia thermohydrogeniphila]
MFVEVVLDIPLDRTFYYKVPEVISYPPEVGKRVIVPFGANDLLRTGIIVSVKDDVDFPEEKIKELFDIPDDFPLFTPSCLELCRFVSDYYGGYFGETLFSFLPGGFEVTESLFVKLSEPTPSVKLTENEKKIVETLKNSSGKLKVSTLRRRVKLSSFYQVLRNLVSKSVVVREELIKRDSVPRERFAVFVKDGEVRGKKSRELLHYLKEKGKESVNTLKALDFSLQVINGLVKKGLIEIVEEKVTLENRLWELKDTKKIKLTPSQEKAFKELVGAKEGKFLLYGVTGSGKMEVYLKVAYEVVKRGKSVLILVPELLLTPELRARVESYFGKNIGIYHGKLTPKEKVSTWLKALRGEVKVFIGTRGAVMLPIKDLGLIVVDEEQDSSYKEQQKPYYHAREVALKRGEIEKFPVLLVSATPSVETYYRSKLGEIKLLELKERVSTVPLPYIKLVNLQETERISIFSKELLAAIENTVKKGEQVLLFINRRGFFAKSFCLNCGYVAECSDCSVPLVYHKSERKLICHLCGKRYEPIYRCPKCGKRLDFFGYGTERVEEELRILFPKFRVVRLDQDTVKNPEVGARLIKEIKEGKYDVIVGTQIATKGHNFPKLTLVGVLLADLLGGAPDYRTSERIFQLIVHTTGRAGRFKPGAAIVQALKPDLPAVKYAATYKFDEFYREELTAREFLGFPPFTKTLLLEFQLEKLAEFKKLREKFEKIKNELSLFFSVSDLTPAPLPKVSGRYRFTSFLRTSSEEKLMKGVAVIKERFPSTFSGIRYKIEVEPMRIV